MCYRQCTASAWHSVATKPKSAAQTTNQKHSIEWFNNNTSNRLSYTSDVFISIQNWVLKSVTVIRPLITPVSTVNFKRKGARGIKMIPAAAYMIVYNQALEYFWQHVQVWSKDDALIWLALTAKDSSMFPAAYRISIWNVNLCQGGITCTNQEDKGNRIQLYINYWVPLCQSKNLAAYL